MGASWLCDASVSLGTPTKLLCICPIRTNMPAVDYSTVPAARSDTPTHLARGLAHKACTWHEHPQRGAMSTQTPQTRSTTEQNTQQDSQYQGYLAMKTQSLAKCRCRYKTLSVALCFGNWLPANHQQMCQCLGRVPNLAAMYLQNHCLDLLEKY